MSETQALDAQEGGRVTHHGAVVLPGDDGYDAGAWPSGTAPSTAARR